MAIAVRAKHGSKYTLLYKKRSLHFHQFNQENDGTMPLASLARAVGMNEAALRQWLQQRIPTSKPSKASVSNETNLRQELAQLGSLFPIRGNVVVPFHRSLVDWLTKKDDRTGYLKAGDYAINAAEGRVQMAYACWAEYQEGVQAMTDYGFRHIRAHLDW